MTATAGRIDVDTIKAAAAGRWPEILTAVGGIGEELLDRKPHPCPKCKGTDRFRFVSEERGAVRCNKCFDKKNGDGIAAIMWVCDINFPSALQRIADHLGVQTEGSNGKAAPSDPLELVARQKGIEPADLQAFGGRVDGPKVVFPMIGWQGNECSTFSLMPAGGKGLYAEGKPAGLFFPHDGDKVRLPKAGETWHIVEGVKDAAALHGLGLLAAGMSTCMMNAKFARLFAGVDVILVPDRDVAAINGAKRTAGGLYDVAKSTRLAALPAEVTEKDGLDVRDILKKPDGRELVLTAIRDARPVDADGTVRDIRLLDRYAAAQLATGNFALSYLVDNVLVEGQPCVFGGPHKSLKTSILMDLSISLATGKPFLGKFAVRKPQRVGFLSGESGLFVLAETAKRIARAAGCNLADLGSSLVVSTTIPRLDRIDDIDALRMFIQNDELTVIVIDPAYLAFSGSADRAGNVFAMGEVLMPMSELCRDMGVTPIIAHHSRKGRIDGQRYAPLELEELAYSGWAEWARQWLLTSRRERYEEGTGLHRLWLGIGGSAGHNGLYGLDVDEGTNTAKDGREWNVSLVPAMEVRERDTKEKHAAKQEEREEDKKVIVKVLTPLWPKGETVATIRAEAHFGAPKTKAILSELTSEGIVETCQVHKSDRDTGRDGFRLKEDPNHV